MSSQASQRVGITTSKNTQYTNTADVKRDMILPCNFPCHCNASTSKLSAELNQLVYFWIKIYSTWPSSRVFRIWVCRCWLLLSILRNVFDKVFHSFYILWFIPWRRWFLDLGEDLVHSMFEFIQLKHIHVKILSQQCTIIQINVISA